MLNKISVLDILASIIRKAVAVICLMIVFALAFGYLKYYRNRDIASEASEKLPALATAVKNADTAYTNLSDRVKALPVSEINPKLTWVASVIYGITSAEDSGDSESAREFCNELKIRWDATDLSVTTADLFLKAADDEGVRELVDLSVSGSRAVLTVKAKNRSQCIALYYTLNGLIMDLAAEETADKGIEVVIEQEEFDMKKTNDSDIAKKQDDYQARIKQLEEEKNAMHDEHDRAVIESRKTRGMKKWGAAGALAGLLLFVAWTVCCDCIYEPVLSAAQTARETGLEYIGTAKRRVSLLDRLAARISGERLKSADTEKGKITDLLKIRTSSDQLTIVTADDCSNRKDLEAFVARLKESGFKIDSRSEDTVIKEKGSDAPALLVLKKDRTTVKETKRLNSLTADSGYKVEGFVFI